MSFEFRRTGVIGAIAALGAVAACNRTSPTMDSGLKADIQAAGEVGFASHSASANLVISPDEAGPNSAPTHKPTPHVPRPAIKPTVRVARREAPTPAPAAQPVTQPTPLKSAPAPAPQPTVAPTPGPTERQPGVYKSEGEIFRQMPWIRP